MRRNLYEIVPDVISGRAGLLDYTVYCPVIEQPDSMGCHTINNFSRHACGEFLKYVNELAAKVNEAKAVARCYQLMHQSRFIISLKYEMNIFDNDLKPFTAVSGAVWNTSNGSRVELKEFFRGNVRYKEMLLYIMSAKIKRKIAAGEKLCPDWHSRIYAAWKNMGYYICREGIVLLLPDNTLREEQNRTEEILIPFAELKNQLGGRLLI